MIKLVPWCLVNHRTKSIILLCKMTQFLVADIVFQTYKSINSVSDWLGKLPGNVGNYLWEIGSIASSNWRSTF